MYDINLDNSLRHKYKLGFLHTLRLTSHQLILRHENDKTFISYNSNPHFISSYIDYQVHLCNYGRAGKLNTFLKHDITRVLLLKDASLIQIM